MKDNNNRVNKLLSLQQDKLCAIPAHSDAKAKGYKSPCGSWKVFQSRFPTESELNETLSKHIENAFTGIVTGKVSGNLEVIDIDCKYDKDGAYNEADRLEKSGKLWERLQTMIKNSLPQFYDNMIYETTTSKGFHIFYRCETIAKNQALAKGINDKVLIETRGEGGFIVCDPSDGYEFQSDGLDCIPTITVEEREKLLFICRTLSEKTISIKTDKKDFSINKAKIKNTCYDRYNQATSIADLLETDGFTILGERNGWIDVLRSGNDTKSSKSGGIAITDNVEILNMFSSSTRYPSGRGLTASSVFHIQQGRDLDNKTDWTETRKDLQELGFVDEDWSDSSKETNITKSKKLTHLDHVHKYFSKLDIRRNEVTQIVEDKDGKEYDDVTMNSRYLDIKQKCPNLSKHLVIDYCYSDRVKTFHPFKDYFDNIDKLEGLVSTRKLFDSINAEFKNDAEKNICYGLFIKWMLQIIASTYRAGPLDIMMIFVGAQNGGKTYFFENLLPSILSKYVTSIKDFSIKGNDDKMMMCNSLLLLRDDITGTGRKDKDFVKYALSAQFFSYRIPFAKSTGKYKRYAVLCATSNDTKVLTSEEKANRRIFPLKVNKRNKALFDEIINEGNGIEKVWSELMNLWEYAKDKRDLYKVTEQEIEYLSEMTEFREVNETEEVIMKYFTENSSAGVTATEIAIALKKKTLKTYAPSKIGKYLSSIGIAGKRTSVSGVKGTYYPLEEIERDLYVSDGFHDTQTPQSVSVPKQSYS